jgi:hypothetical protein
MNAERMTRVLVVTDHTEVSPDLLAAMRLRAGAGPVQFRVLIPNPAKTEAHLLHPERHELAAEAETALRGSLSALELAAGGPVIGSVSVRHDPYLAVEEVVASEPVDEFILALAPHGLLRRLHLDLPHRLAHFGLPLIDVALAEARR